MGGFDNEMLILINHGLFTARISTPSNKYQMWSICVKVFDDVLSKGLPTFAAMTAGKVCLDSQSIIK